jgi:hypothetical protein
MIYTNFSQKTNEANKCVGRIRDIEANLTTFADEEKYTHKAIGNQFFQIFE